MKLSSLINAGESTELSVGSEAYFRSIEDIIVIGEAVYLRAGITLVNEQDNYPELFANFAVDNRVTAPQPRPLANGEVINYMRIK